MARILIRLTLMSSAPAPLMPRPTSDTLAPFGRWLRERVGSAALDWPAVALHRLHFTPCTMELVLLADPATPPLSSGLGLARALARELDLAARRSGWVRGPLWSDMGVWVAARGGEVGRAAVVPSAPRPGHEHHRQRQEDRIH
jgi:hypothetical protein